MKTEIERKFLVAHEGWRARVTGRRHLIDGLVARSGGVKVRVRIDGLGASLAVKGPRVGLSREEYERPIPLAEARAMLTSFCGDRVVTKTCHIVPHAGFDWEVDVYEGLLRGVVLAEVELDDEAQRPVLPDWVGREVTDDPAYGKQALLEQRLRAREPA